MCMKITQHKGIAWELMNRLVAVIDRIIADVTCGIREPVR